jgi:predicted nucleic acid-binding protein
VIVVDASVLSNALAEAGDEGELAREAIAGERLMAPAIVDLEVLSIWRRAARAGRLGAERARQALQDLAAIQLQRVPNEMLTARIWDLRHNLSAYDAAYVALAEVMEARLFTADGRIARAPKLGCDVVVVS